MSLRSALAGIRRNAFDIRAGEYARTIWMSLYLLCVMVAYYILKPVSASMFLNRFDVTRLPYLYILIALFGGLLAYLYTRVAVRASLTAAVRSTMAIAVACLAVLWIIVSPERPWMLYVFNIWVSLFSIVLASQGWLVASRVFNPREAKRVYGLLGLGAVLGAGVGSVITNWTATLLGTHNLILASGVWVVAAYVAFHMAARQPGVSLATAQAAESGEAGLTWGDILADVGQHRHLQIIMAIIVVMFMVDELVDFQFQSVAKHHFQGDALTVFFARFNVWLNTAAFLLQLVATSWLVHRMGVGGALLVNPVTLVAASAATIAVPGLYTAVAARFLEALNRYTFNRTAMELLYLPLPVELRNRTKAFVDIFVDRAGRGVAGILLIVLIKLGIDNVREVASATVVCALTWVVLARVARGEYVGSVRRRLERRRLAIEEARVAINDAETVALLEETAVKGNARQACYAIRLLGEARSYWPEGLLRRLAGSDSPEVRAALYDLARTAGDFGLLDRARAEIAARGAAMSAAAGYVLAWEPDPVARAREWLLAGDPAVAEAAVQAIAARSGITAAVSDGWLEQAAASADSRWRRVAALAVAARGPRESALGETLLPAGREDRVLLALLDDPRPAVAAAACRAAGAVQSRACVDALVRRLAEPQVRGAAIAALAAYNTRIAGMLGDLLGEESLPPVVRRQIPRVLRRIPDQRSVDSLLRYIGHEDLSIRAAVLRALNRLREAAPGLSYGEAFVVQRIFEEARQFFLLRAAVESLGGDSHPRSASALLMRSLEERCRQALERVFRLIGLKYPSREIQLAWLAVQGRRQEQVAAALEFLDTVLEPSLRRVLLPMLDAPDRAPDHGRELFGLMVENAEAALRELLHSGDDWLTACAMAAAAERGYRNLTADIAAVAERAGTDIAEVARDAAAVLA